MNKSYLILGLVMMIMLVSVSAGKIEYDFVICGSSMSPLINHNIGCTWTKVITAKEENLKIGDVVCFNFDKRMYPNHYSYICHEIYYVDDDKVCTTAINPMIKDKCVNRYDVALKVLL